MYWTISCLTSLSTKFVFNRFKSDIGEVHRKIGSFFRIIESFLMIVQLWKYGAQLKSKFS
jgi:hypothetical protein